MADNDVVVAVERFVAGSGTQDMTASALGGLTPAAVLIYSSSATSDGVAADHAMRLWGIASGSANDFSLSTVYEHNKGTSEVGSVGRNYCMRFTQDALTYNHDGFGNLNSFITNGMRITWDSNPGEGYLITCVFFAGSGLEAYANTEALTNSVTTIDVTGVGFEPDLVFHAGIDQVGTTDEVYVNALSLGVSHNDRVGGITEFATVNRAPSGQAEGELWAYHGAYAMVMNSAATGNLDWYATTEDYDSDGFTYNVQNDGANFTHAYFLALRFTSASAKVWEHSTPVATGEDAQEGIGFTPQVVGMFLSGIETQDSGYPDNRAGTTGVSWFDGTGEFCNTISGEDLADPTNAQSLSDDRAIAVPDDDGTLIQEGSFVSMDADGFTLDWDTVHGTAKLWPAWAIAGDDAPPPPDPPDQPDPVNVEGIVQMIFDPVHITQKGKASTLLYLPFDGNACNSGSDGGGAGSYAGGLIYTAGCAIGTGAVQVAESTCNQCTNPSFEVGTTGWNTQLGANISRSASLAYTGSYSGLAEWTGFGSAACSARFGFTLPNTCPHVAHARVYTWDGTFYAGGVFGFFDFPGASIDNTFHQATPCQWQSVSATITASSGNLSGSLCLTMGGGLGGDGKAFIDAVQIEQKPYPTPYADGSLGDGHTWAGTAHDSTSARSKTDLAYAISPTGDAFTISFWWSPTTLDEEATDRLKLIEWWGDTENYIQIQYTHVTDKIYSAIEVNDVLVFLDENERSMTRYEELYWTLVWDGSTVTLYRNGIAQTDTESLTESWGTTPSILYVGADHNGALQGNGWMDELLVLNTALTADEVLALYTGQSEGNPFGGDWVDVTDDVIRDVKIKYGITGTGPLDRVATTGTMRMSMKNDRLNTGGVLGYYSPDHSDARSGFDVGTPVRLRLTYSGSVRYKWLGTIDDIKPLPGKHRDRQVRVTAVDWFDVAAGAKVSLQPIQFNATADEGITSLLTSMLNQPTASVLATGQDAFPTIFDSSRDERTAVSTELSRLVMSELGYFYIRGSSESGGEVVFEDRHARAKYGAATACFTDACIMGFDVDRSSQNIFNKVKVEVNPREIDASASVLFTLQSTPLLPPSGSIIIEGRYTDPVQRGTLRIGGASMVDSASDTDYKMWTASDGSGTDLTGNFTVSTCYGGNTVRYEISNDGVQSGYITLLQARGKAIAVREPSISEKIDADSIQSYGESVLKLNMPYQEDALVADDAAGAMLATWKSPVSIGKKLNFLAHRSAGLMTAALLYEPGDKVRITETVTGIDQDYFINGIEMIITEEELLKVSWIVTPAAAGAYWILGVIGSSELGETTYVGY